jgi:hypothetical protein
MGNGKVVSSVTEEMLGCIRSIDSADLADTQVSASSLSYLDTIHICLPLPLPLSPFNCPYVFLIIYLCFDMPLPIHYLCSFSVLDKVP